MSDEEIRDYLSQLVQQLPTREAAAALGYSLTSYSSLKRLLDMYGVGLPLRTNQYSDTEDDSEVHLVAHKVSAKPAHRKKVDIEKCLVFGDVHGRHVDARSYGVMLAVAKDVQPEYVIINGDFIDFESISRFAKEPMVELELQAEIDNAIGLLDALISVVPNAKITYIEGNHEARLRAYLYKDGKALTYLKDEDGNNILTVSERLGLRKRGIEYVQQQGKSAYTRYGAITVGHFDKYSSIPASVARWFLEHRNESVIQGHTHKRCQVDRRFPDGREITCIEHGHLMSANPDYVTDPDWAQGFVIITKRKDTDRFHTELIRIVDHECLVGDTLYSG